MARYSTAAAVATPESPVPAGRRPVALPINPTPPAPTAPEFEPLERSVKGDRRALLLFSIPIPPSAWPSHLEIMSPLIGDAAFALKKQKIGVNAYYDGTGDKSVPGRGEAEVYPATLVYPDGKRFHFPAFSADTLKSDEWDQAATYRSMMDISLAPPNFLPQARGMREYPEILVCTHGSRDCRCSDKGGKLVDKLREVVAEHKLNIPIREVGHVGGHK